MIYNKQIPSNYNSAHEFTSVLYTSLEKENLIRPTLPKEKETDVKVVNVD